jgi:putative dimethyl sulfoxide reductase chaperone
LIEGFMRVSKNAPVEELKNDLGVDRTRLLRGLKPGYGPPPPYESVYTGTKEAPALHASMAVQQAYAEAGVGLPKEVRDQPDFIGLEIDFMRYLTEKESEAWTQGNQADALLALRREQSFLQEHMLPWIPQFSDVMFQQAALDFYRGIGRMTKGFVRHDAHDVAGLVEEISALQRDEEVKDNE